MDSMYMKHRKVSPFIYLCDSDRYAGVGVGWMELRARPGPDNDTRTTDLHGNINPIDYGTNKPDNRGLPRSPR